MTDPRWWRAPTALWRTVLGEVVVLVPGADEPVVLSGSTSSVWRALTDGATAAELLAALGGAAAVPGSALEDTLSAMCAAGLVVQR